MTANFTSRSYSYQVSERTPVTIEYTMTAVFISCGEMSTPDMFSQDFPYDSLKDKDAQCIIESIRKLNYLSQVKYFETTLYSLQHVGLEEDLRIKLPNARMKSYRDPQILLGVATYIDPILIVRSFKVAISKLV